MTQLLDIHTRIAEPTNTKGIVAPLPTSAATAQTGNKIETFVITFAIAFAILYTVFERWNWPLFTYHPAVGKIDFWMHAARSGEGPPMYWYGWLALAFPCAAVIGWGATLLDWRLVQRLTLFFCFLTLLWSLAFGVAVFMDGRTAFDADLVQSLAWITAAPAFLAAAALSYFFPIHWAERIWPSWMFVMPIGGLVILAYSLKQYFLR